LVSLHQDVEFIYVNKETASLRLQALVNIKVKEIINNKLDPVTKQQYENALTLLKNLQEKGVDSIYPAIRPSIATQMWEEFKSLYQSPKDQTEFNALIDGGIYVDLGDLSPYFRRLAGTRGEYDFIRENQERPHSERVSQLLPFRR